MTRGGREHMPDCNGEGHPPEQCKELYREGLAGMRRIAKLGGGRESGERKKGPARSGSIERSDANTDSTKLGSLAAAKPAAPTEEQRRWIDIELLLKERIRALEAELAEWKRVAIEKDDLLDRVQDYPEVLARAEKAEAELQRLADEGLTTEERDVRIVDLKAEVERLKRRMRWYSGLAECDACNHAHQKHEGPGDREPVEREGGT